MTRILRVRDVNSPKTPRKMTGTGPTDRISGSFHDPAQLVGRIKSKLSVRRLMVKDPLAPLSRDVVNQFTNNPNPKFDPSKAPGAVQVKKTPAQKATSSPRAGHQKVIMENNQVRTGGKTLRRR